MGFPGVGHVTVTPLRQDDGGIVRVGETRVTLDSVIYAFRRGATAEEIVQRFPTLTLIDVYAVISYYLSDTDRVDAYLEDRQAEAATVRAEHESRLDPQGIRARLLARREEAAS